MNRIDPRYIDLGGRLLLLAVFALFAALLSHHVVQPVRAARDDVSTLHRAIRILNETEGDVAQLNAEIRRVAECVAACEALLPENPNLDAFLARIGKRAAANDVRIERLTPGALSTHRLYRAQEIEVRATGSFLALFGFLQDLEHGPQLSRIAQLRLISPLPGDPCAADLELILYCAPAKETD